MMPPIRIGIELRRMMGLRTGIGNYSFHLIRELSKDPDLSFVGFHHARWSSVAHKDMLAIDQAFGPDVGKQSSRASRFISKSDTLKTAYRLGHGTAFRLTVAAQRLDLFHALNFIPPADPGVTILPVVYDASFIRYPEAHPKERLRWLDRLAKTLDRAPCVQTISEFSRREIASIYGYPAERIVVAPPAANPIFRPHGGPATRQALLPLNLPYKSYILAVGTLEPRKNLSTIIAAYSRLSPNIRQLVPLVVAGGIGWGNLDLPKEAAALEREGSLYFTGYVSDLELRNLYEGAIALLFPSFYEGFGMPIVEAMSCGTPVIHSIGSSMEEITAGLGGGLDALDVAGWSLAIEHAIGRSATELKTLEPELIKRARTFSWVQSARIVKQMFVSIYAHEYARPHSD